MDKYSEKNQKEGKLLQEEITRLLREKKHEKSPVAFKDYIDYANRLIDLMNENRDKSVPIIDLPFFRGQSKSTYPLCSTLERERSRMYVSEYYLKVNEVLPIFETHLDINFSRTEEFYNFIDPMYFDNKKSSSLIEIPGKLPMGELLVFLRHHGFPSPLLDWSESPYVAAYFAFRDVKCSEACVCKKGSEEASKVAIFMLVKTVTGISGGNMAESQIFEYHHHAKSTPRHYIQKARYTVCLGEKREASSEADQLRIRYYFDSHQNVFDRDSAHPTQNIVIKFELKTCERKSVLEQLDRMNINEYTLMNTVDSLAYWQKQKVFA
ncbi:FRG domain-containing protein [bacterium]|nr:FRG domain-containing protein [bacterium]